MAFTAHFITEGEANITAVTLSCEECPGSHTAQNLAQKFNDCMKKFGITDAVITLTTDTASNIKKAGVELLSPEWHGCAAHKIELAIKPILNEPSVKATLAKHNKMATHLHASTRTTGKLNNLQKVCGQTAAGAIVC